MSSAAPELPAGVVVAHDPPEARGLERDEVRLMVATPDRLRHVRFKDLPGFLTAGDVLAVNTSMTIPAALPARRCDGLLLELHVSTRLPAGVHLAELRMPAGHASEPFFESRSGDELFLPAGGRARLLAPYPGSPVKRLWLATLSLPEDLFAYLARYGQPIRYGSVGQAWGLEHYQTVFARVPGSAEMPSAARPFSHRLVTGLVAKGVVFAPVVLHCAVSSLEGDEPPVEEFFAVPRHSARLVNEARAAGGRVIAVGTTTVRALETASDEAGTVHPGEGWTSLVITPERGVRVADGLITGWHEPQASHRHLIEALAGRDLLERSYAEAARLGYAFHEFGDSHLVLMPAGMRRPAAGAF